MHGREGRVVDDARRISRRRFIRRAGAATAGVAAAAAVASPAQADPGDPVVLGSATNGHLRLGTRRGRRRPRRGHT